MRSRSKTWAGALLLPVILAISAGATTAPQLDIPDLTRQADVIVLATATTDHSVWIEGNLYTSVTLEVHETLKGKTAPQVTLILPGGVDADRPVPVATLWPGQPRIDPGERVLLFLRELSTARPPRHDTYSIVGFSQGKFTLGNDADGAAVAVQDLRGLRLVNPDGSHLGDQRRTRLENLRQEVQRALTPPQREDN